MKVRWHTNTEAKNMQINLANTRLFRGMEPSDIEEMLGCLHAKEHAFQKGEIIFPEGVATEQIGVVLSGRVIIEMGDVWGNNSVLSRIGPGGVFDGARLLIAADCTAYAYAAFHERFIKGHITLVGCPKLDSVDYSEKLTEIIRSNDIKSVTVVRMEVPCCGGLEMAAKKALRQSGKFIPWQVVTVTVDGLLMEE